VGDVHLRGIVIQQQILDADVAEFIYPRPGLEQRLEHEPVYALMAVGGLNQTFDFAELQSGDRAGPRARLAH
jgi:hypothetical protein